MTTFKNLKKWYYSLVMAITVMILCSFTLVKTHDRGRTYRLPRVLSSQVTRETRGMNEAEIIDYSLNLTAQLLQFEQKNDIANGKANCVGYALVCAAICNQALRSNGYTCRAKSVVGYVNNCGVNLCNSLGKIMPTKHWQNFVKDHDFVELSYGGKTYYFDPSIYDVLGNKCLTVK